MRRLIVLALLLAGTLPAVPGYARSGSRMRRAATPAGPGRRVRLTVHLTRGARRALEHALRTRSRTSIRLELHAHDASGNRAPPVALRIRVRR